MDELVIYLDKKPVRKINKREFNQAFSDIFSHYSEQAETGYFTGDILFEKNYNLPYWEYLGIEHVKSEKVNSLLTGSLIIIASMCLEPYEELGDYFLSEAQRFKTVQKSINIFEPRNKDQARLKKIIVHLLEGIADRSMPDSAEKELQWVYTKFIYGHFRNGVNSFDAYHEILFKKINES